MATATSELEVVIKAKDEASATLKDIQKTAGTIGKTFTAVGGVLAGALGLAVKSASDAQVQMAKFDATLSAVGKAGLEARSALVQAGDATLKLGFDNEEATVSLGKLFQRTGSVTEAIKLNSLAMDLARAKNIDLSTASKLVTKVIGGQGRALQEYGIILDETKTPLEALAELQVAVGGQAQAFAGTFAGASEVLKQQVGELTEKIGAQLLPIITNLVTKFTPIIEKVIAWTNENPKLTEQIVLATAVFAGLLLVLGPLLLLFSALSVTMLAVGAGIVAIGALVFLLIKHWERVSEVMSPVIDGIKEFATLAYGFLKPAIDLLLVVLKVLWEQLKALWAVIGDELITVLKWIGIFLGATLVGLIAGAIVAVTAIVAVIAGFAHGVQLLIDKFGSLILWLQVNIPKGLEILKTTWTSTWESIKNVTTAVTDFIAKKIERIISLWNSAKDIAGKVGSGLKDAGKAVTNAVGSLAGKAGGGQVVGGQSYIVGERGKELFTPSQSGSITPNNQLGGGGGITVNINGGTYLSESVAKDIGDKIISQFRRTVRI